MKKVTFLIMALIFFTSAIGQKVITGQVKTDTGEPVSFATVTEAGTKNSARADAEGKFSIRVKDNAQLTVTATGFNFLTAPATGGDIVLVRRIEEMQEVVITTGLGIQRQAKEVGYATAKIRGPELTQAKAVNLQQGLTGKVSGLNVVTTNNSVFENTKINLRGIRSLTGNNQPLLVVDGIPTPLSYVNSLNPNDVQDVNILKGASAAAIYGPDGVNGVIIVNTRKGTKANPIITYSKSAQVSRVSYMPQRQRRFGTGSVNDVFGNPIYDPFENFSYGDRYDGSIRNVGHQLEDGTYQQLKYAATPEDEQKKFFNSNGSVIQDDISFSTQDYYISAQHATIKGIIPEDVNRRTAVRFNAGKEVGRLKTSFNLSYTQSNYNVMSQAAYAARFPAYSGSIYNAVLQTAAHIPLTSYKNWETDYYSQYSNYYNEYAANPYWAIDNHRERGRTDDLLGSLELKYTFKPWLQATGRVGSSFSFNNSKITAAALVPSAWAQANRSGTLYSARQGLVIDDQNMNSRINAEFFLNGRREIRDFSVNYLLGTQFRQNQSKKINVRGDNLVVPGLYNISNRTGEIVGDEENFKSRLGSVMGSIGVGYKGWVNVEFTARNDWDSRLSADNNSYFYPGVSTSLVLSDALGFSNGSIISYLKLRASYAKSGNVNLGVYALEPIYTSAGGFPYGSLPGYTANNNIPDPNLKPEFVQSKEIGFELALLKNRIGLDATYFHQNNTDQILAVQTSAATGYTSRLANTADFKNYGVELDLRLTPLFNFGRNAKLDLKVNATYNDNKIIRLSDGVDELTIGTSNAFIQTKVGAPEAYNFAIVGMPAFVFKLTDYVRDPMGRVIVDAVTGNPSLSDSLVTRGRTMPKWIVGINPSFTWKAITIGMTWDFKGGHHLYHGLGSDMDGYGISARSAQYDRQRFVFPNSVYFDGSKYVENTDRQVSGNGIDFWGNDAYNGQVATNYFTKADALKLRELVLNYEFPARLFANSGFIKKVSFSLIGRNLLTFLPKSNQWSDPEFNYTNDNNTAGLSSVFQTPPVRTFGASLNLTF